MIDMLGSVLEVEKLGVKRVEVLPRRVYFFLVDRVLSTNYVWMKSGRVSSLGITVPSTTEVLSRHFWVDTRSGDGDLKDYSEGIVFPTRSEGGTWTQKYSVHVYSDVTTVLIGIFPGGFSTKSSFNLLFTFMLELTCAKGTWSFLVQETGIPTHVRWDLWEQVHC